MSRFQSLPLLVLLVGCGRVNFDIDDTPRGDLPAYTSAVVSDGAIAYFPFDEAAGATTVRDTVGGIVGTLEGTFGVHQAGPIVGSSSLHFDGDSTRIDLGDRFAFSGMVPYTFELWIRPTGIVSTRFIIDRRTTATPTEGYSIYLGDDYLLAARTTNATEGSYVEGGTPVVDHWTYFVVTYEYPVPTMYLNGVLVSDNEGADTVIGGGPGNFVLGDDSPGQTKKYEGELDNLAIYDRALTDAEVAEHWRLARQ